MLKQTSMLNLLIQGSKRTSISELTTRNYKNLRKTRLGMAYLATHNSRRKTKDLVALLLAHGEQARRNSLPTTQLRLAVTNKNGIAAVKIRMQT